MIGVSVIGAGAVAANMGRLRSDLLSARDRGLAMGSLLVRRELAVEMTQPSRVDPFWGKTGALSGLSRRSGGTVGRLSPGGVVTHLGDTAFAAVGSPDKYVKELEEGGTSSSGGYFRIPTAAAQTGAGVDRLLGRSFRDLPGGFLLRSKDGKLWGATRAGERLTFLYLFVKSITHSAHHVFGLTQARTQPEVAAILGAEVAVTVRSHA
jgi:hypothetical protein